MTAYDGIARPMLATLIIRFAQRPVWPTYRPNGSAMSVAVTRTSRRADREVLEEPVRDPGLALPVGRVGEPGDDHVHQRAAGRIAAPRA